MSEDEKKVIEETAESPQATCTKPAPKKKCWPIVISAISVIAIAVLVAFLHWHEEPSFCNTFCHQPMDYYVEGYYSEDPALSVANHAAADVTCLGCHWSQAKMLDLVHEVVLTVTDSFTEPLPDQTEFVNDEFCGACHDGETAPTKESVTEGWAYDPHNIPTDVSMHQGQDFACGSCHKVHKQSVLTCAECHEDFTAGLSEEMQNKLSYWEVPTNEAKAATAETYGVYDPHAGDAYVQFSPMHETAGADGGTITCADCHDTNTIKCAQCHLNTFEGNVPEGWSIPEGAMDVSALAEEAPAAEDEGASDGASTDAGAVDMSAVADGTYEGTGKGIGGDVPVTVTVEGGVITAVEVGDNSETQGIGSKAIEQLPALIVEANGIEGVDTVSGATITSNAIFDAVTAALSGATA